MITLTFLGAAGEVTGSSTLVETSRARVLVDFGLHQGGVAAELRNRRFLARRFPQQESLSAVVLTHAHVDHCGRLPFLATWNYKGAIHATPATCDVTALMLRDSARVQEADLQWTARIRARQGREAPTPLYTEAEVERVLPLLNPLPYDEWREIADGIRIRFFDAGHILGSASVEMRVLDAGIEKVIVFSGDLGPKGVPLMHDPTPPPPADAVLLEATYGDRDHRSLSETTSEFHDIISNAVWDKQKVLLPAFAVGRTQQLIYQLASLVRTGGLPKFPVYLDSPMAITATELYRRHRNLFDAEAQALIDRGDGLLDLPGLIFTRTPAESRELNDMWGASVIIAASGMCTGGRILHHLKHNLWRRGAHVVIVGYQAAGSLGRRLVEGETRVRVLGEWIAVRAKIHTLGGFSAHAGRTDLLDWVSHTAAEKPRLFLNHAEERPRQSLGAEIKRRYNWDAEYPGYLSASKL